MHLLILGNNYFPEKTGIAPFTTGLAEHLVAQGHRVSVAVTFPHYPDWAVQPPYQGKLFLREEIKGVAVHRGYAYIPQKPGALQRILYDTSLSLTLLLWGLTVPKVDVVLAITPPVQLGLMGWVLSRLKGASFIYQVQDLAVDAAIAVGMLENSRLVGVARSIEDFIYHRAQYILVVCQGFADRLLSRNVSASKIHLISNWVDTAFIRPLERNNSFRHSQGWGEKQFIVAHAGNMGAKQGLENVVCAAECLRTQSDILFALIGEGSERNRMITLAEQCGLANVSFIPLQPKELLPQVLSAADVLLLNQRASIIDMVIPSKLLTYMAAGRPIVAAVHPESEVAKYIRQAGCGMVVPPEKPDQLAEAICQIRDNPDQAERFAKCARAFAEEHFSKDRVLRQYEEFFGKL